MFHLVTDCNRLGTSRGFFNEIWVASACIARITGYSETVRGAGGLVGNVARSRVNAPPEPFFRNLLEYCTFGACANTTAPTTRGRCRQRLAGEIGRASCRERG